jgi:hypothetical protein
MWFECLICAPLKLSAPPPVTGTQQPRLQSSTSQHRAKCTLTSYFDTILRAYDVTAVLKIPCWDRHDYVFNVWAISTGVLVLSYTESVQQPVRGDGS